MQYTAEILILCYSPVFGLYSTFLIKIDSIPTQFIRGCPDVSIAKTNAPTLPEV